MNRKTESPSASKRRITIERTYAAHLEDVWEMWTTKEGVESWWGPGGFSVEVQKLDLRPGGEMHYTMTAVDPPQVEFMKREGMPLTTRAHIQFTEVTPRTRLAYEHRVDFVPGVEVYTVLHTIELVPSGSEVRLRLTIDAMHDEEWTNRAVQGWTEELGKLASALGARGR